MPEKKAQHYIPQFYLRFFSFEDNQREIGLYNIANDKFVQRAPIKSQACKSWYYGKDGRMEKWLSKAEGFNTKAFRYLMSDGFIDTRDEFKLPLYYYLALFDLRNPSFAEFMEHGLAQTLQRIGELPEVPQKIEDKSKLIDDFLQKTFHILKDLSVKLLINDTDTPFITSDYPIIKYNQFQERHHTISGTGLGALGLQVILPINFGQALFFYDSSIYKVGTRKSSSIDITDDKEIDQINLLQYLGAYSTIFFNDLIKSEYVNILKEKSIKYGRSNKFVTELFLNDGTYSTIDSRDNRMYLLNTISGCRIGMKLSCVKELDKAKSRLINPKDLHIREKAQPFLKNTMTF